MDTNEFKEKLRALAKRTVQMKESITTEEATKTSIIMPFFQLLGYSIFDPTEFVPEFVADVGIKKGEKVDYAIMLNEQPVILVEAKSIKEKLTKHDSQLFRYFGTTSSKFGILTNGEEYKFFTDLEEPNKMDSVPFLTINFSNLKDSQITEILKFHKDNFDVENITSTASELKYLNRIQNFLQTQLQEPSEEFLKYITGEVYDGVKTKQLLETFKPIVLKGFTQFINEMVNEKLSKALNTSIEAKLEEKHEKAAPEEEVEIEVENIEISEEHLEVYTISKLILRDVIKADRIFYRPNRSYLNILIDDNIRKWTMRVFISANRKWIVLNDTDKTQFEFSDSIDLINYSEQIKKVALKCLIKK